MKLRELAGGHAGARLGGAGGDPHLTAIVHYTRDVVPGSLFCCVRGSHVDGHDLAADAVGAGAGALVVDHELALGVPQIVVTDVRRAMGPLAAAFWGHPSHDVDVVGVTGTSGKTTVTHMLRPVLEASGYTSCAVIGTLSGARTTPEATDLQALLAEVRDAGAAGPGRAAVAMEVSSHGLALHRVDGTRFAVTVFTNLSQDHLDFHHTMDAYFAAKAALFTPAFGSRAVVCRDDAWGRRLLERLEAEPDVVTTSYSGADAEGLELSPAGASFGWRGEPVTLRMAGRHNVTNAVAAAAAAEALGIGPEAVARGLSAAAPVPGRFEAVGAGEPFGVIVDYAHKPDALDKALRAARELVRDGGRLVAVFGCGGDRDAAKRPLMGEVAARLADAVILTSDNPRSEDPETIIDEIRAGVPTCSEGLADVTVEVDRRRAIDRAIAEAHPGDVVIIAGKGHETTQIVRDTARPFDDREVARAALAERSPPGWGDDG